MLNPPPFPNAITGDPVTLLGALRYDLRHASGVSILVSFLMEKGARLIVDDLKELVQKAGPATPHHPPIRILTGRYLNITEPPALYLLMHELGPSADIRFYRDETVSFHPKAYILQNSSSGVIYIGSSNLSHSALTRGIEWNYRLER